MKKRIMALCLSLVMILSVYTPAFAAVSVQPAKPGIEDSSNAGTEPAATVQTNTELGDVDQSNRVDLTDAQIVLKFALKIKNMSDTEFQLADVNRSGTVDLMDAQLILKKALKIIDNYDVVFVENVTISKTYATMDIGNTLLLTATVYPTNASNRTISWSSSDTKVATVSQNGQVQAVGEGTATITASAGGYSAKCLVTVENNNTSFSANCRALKNYIMLKGSTNTKGNKFIKMVTGDSTALIVYEAENNLLHFIFYLLDYTFDTTVDMYINMDGASSEQVKFILLYHNSRLGCSANTVVDAKSFSESSNLYFKADTLVNLKESEIQNIANIGLKTAFRSWDLLLLNKLNMTMSDIGFVSYK